MKKVAFHTLGCKVNQYETQAMIEMFQEKGYLLVNDIEFADVYVINTCTVTNMGDKKSRQFIRRAKRKNPLSIIAVIGCYAQRAPKEVLGMEGVNIVIGTNDRNKIVDLVESCDIGDKINFVDDIMKIKNFEDMAIRSLEEKTRVFLKIQEGCNQYCSYCIIPYTRGPIRSRDRAKIIEEVENFARQGFKEIVLTGIHVASYGKDLKEKDGLVHLLKDINNIGGLDRIRLSSLDPTVFTDSFLEQLVHVTKLCDHFHLSLQSGCNETLKKMNRKYTADQYEEIVKNIRRLYPQIALTTDIIVGFPGETEEDFQTSYDFVEKIGFSDIHVFKFSPREGTAAADFKNQVDGKVKHIRSEKLIFLGNELRNKYYEQFIGSRKTVLFESTSKENKAYVEGYTSNYLKVLVEGGTELVGKIKKVKLRKLEKGFIVGEII